MKVNCPSCKRAYKVDDSRVQGQGIVMRCPQCGGNFFVTPSGIVRDASSGSIPTEPLPDVSSVQPRRPSQSPRGTSSTPPSFEESGSGKFEFRGDAVTVKPASKEKLGGAGTQAGSARSVAIRDSWGFEMAPFAGVELDLPMKKADPFDDLGLAVAKQEASMELRAVGPEENTVDLPALVDMAERESRAAPKPKAPPPAPKLSDDPFGEIVLGQSPKEGGKPSPKEGGKPPPPPPPKPAPAPVLVSSVPPALTMSSDESDFGDIRLSGMEMKLSTPPKAPTSRGSVAQSPENLGIDLVGGRASPSLPPLGSSMTRDAGASKPPEKEEIKLASVPPMGFGYGEFDLGSPPSGHGEGEFDLGGATQQRPARPSGGAQPALPSLRPSPADSASEFDAIPTNRGAESKGRGEYDGPPREKIELAVDPLERLSDKGRIIDDAVPQKAGSRAKKFAGWRRLERQSRKVKLALLGVLLLVIGIGVSLNWTPLGLFGTTAIANMLPSSAAERVVEDKARLVSDALLKDDFRECQDAHGEVSLALQELPKQEDLRLLGVFLVNYVEHRFGEDKRLSTEAGKWLGSIQLEESESKWAPLARGARDVRTGATDLGYLSSIDPKLKAHALALQVMAAIASRKPDAALPFAKELQSAQAQTPRSGFFMAQALAAAGKGKEAIAALEKLLELAPKHTDGAALLARELLEVRPLPTERIQKVVADVVARARPRVAASAQAVLARLHYALRHFVQAKEAADQALRGFSNEPIALVVKGDLALQDGDPALAATMYNRALAEAPSNLAASLGLVEVKLHEGRLTEAKDKAFALVNANKGSARAHYVMGLALESIDSGEAARAELKKAIELDAEGLDAYLALARSHMKAKEDAEAMAILDKAAAALPGNPIVARTLAAAQGARGDYAAAIVELNKAVEMAPDDPETYFMMAQMYRQMKSFPSPRSRRIPTLRFGWALLRMRSVTRQRQRRSWQRPWQRFRALPRQTTCSARCIESRRGRRKPCGCCSWPRSSIGRAGSTPCGLGCPSWTSATKSPQ
ncbi:MAG: zinc-ribbon domain-containing protein [Myxococcota bacterium]|nr:zinc-ribbon domain-containing protein [Myxococcota bacterium]